MHCGRFGAIVRLEDGRLASLPSSDAGMTALRHATSGGRKPEFPFAIEEEHGRRVRVTLADSAGHALSEETFDRPSTSFEQKIIDYLRQTAEWNPRALAQARRDEARRDDAGRADRLLPFEYRARRQYRDSPQRPRRPKR